MLGREVDSSDTAIRAAGQVGAPAPRAGFAPVDAPGLSAPGGLRLERRLAPRADRKSVV